MGRDLHIQAMLMIQSWKPQERTLKKNGLVEYWKKIDLLLVFHSGSGPDCRYMKHAYTLSLLHKRDIPTMNTPYTTNNEKKRFSVQHWKHGNKLQYLVFPSILTTKNLGF